MFLAERYLRRRYWEGFAEGFAEERAECDAEWVAWLSRLQEAEARGEPFDEPTPAEQEARNRPQDYS